MKNILIISLLLFSGCGVLKENYPLHDIVLENPISPHVLVYFTDDTAYRNLSSGFFITHNNRNFLAASYHAYEISNGFYVKTPDKKKINFDVKNVYEFENFDMVLFEVVNVDVPVFYLILSQENVRIDGEYTTVGFDYDNNFMSYQRGKANLITFNTTVTIKGGMSGGATLDSRGNVIGINQAFMSGGKRDGDSIIVPIREAFSKIK